LAFSCLGNILVLYTEIFLDLQFIAERGRGEARKVESVGIAVEDAFEAPCQLQNLQVQVNNEDLH